MLLAWDGLIVRAQCHYKRRLLAWGESFHNFPYVGPVLEFFVIHILKRGQYLVLILYQINKTGFIVPGLETTGQPVTDSLLPCYTIRQTGRNHFEKVGDLIADSIKYETIGPRVHWRSRDGSTVTSLLHNIIWRPCRLPSISQLTYYLRFCNTRSLED